SLHDALPIYESDETVYNSFTLPKSIFEEGNNRIAVEIHNRSLSSSDIAFDMSITYLLYEEPEDVVTTSAFPLEKGSGWAYNDLGPGNLEYDWKEQDFENSSWSAGYRSEERRVGKECRARCAQSSEE